MSNEKKGSRLDDLKKQLLSKGVAAPETITHCGIDKINDNLLGLISGGFGQIVGFNQFGQFSQRLG